MGFKEILEAKKLAEASKTAVNNVAQAIMAAPAKEASKILETIADPVKKEEASVMPGKLLSFTEKMALKKQASTLAPELAAPTVSIPAQEDTMTAVAQQVSSGIASAALANLPLHSSNLAQSQAYADIKVRIDALNAMSETNLGSAMTELKKALMSNPAAVELMLDSDYGQMVAALNRLVQEDIIEVAKDKKESKKKTKVDLTDPAQVEALFNEL